MIRFRLSPVAAAAFACALATLFGASLPAPSDQSGPAPRAGEMEWTGVVKHIDRDARTMVVAVQGVVRPDGSAVSFRTPEIKSVALTSWTLVETPNEISYLLDNVVAGAPVAVIGQDFGSNRPLKARLVTTAHFRPVSYIPPSQAAGYAGSENVPAVRTVALRPGAPPAGAAGHAAGLLPDGSSAPNFEIVRSDGAKTRLSDFAGQVVVLDFWATWCGPCQASLPGTDKLAGAYQSRGVKFLPICTWDEQAKFQTWVAARPGWNMSFYYDPAGRNMPASIASGSYGVHGIPTQYVIGKDGRIVASHVGMNPQLESDLTTAIEKALAE